MLDFLKNRTTQLVIGLLILFSIISLWMRLLPMFGMGNVDILSMVASDDPLYNLRQVEQILVNYPYYAWYDPMTLFPVGSVIYWGELFPLIIATICLLAGVTTRPEIISIGLLVPPIMGMLMVPVMYFIGKIAGDWKTGVLAAGFTAIVSGQFFFRSFYGYMDHHIAEVLFSSIFCLLYMYVLYLEKDTKIILTDLSTYKRLIILSFCAGIAYVVGLLIMPTMILFAMIVSIFTLLQFIIDVIRKRDVEYLVLINTIVFSVAILALLLYGFKTQNLNLSSYSIGHVYAYFGIIGVTGFFYILAQRFKETPIYFPLTLGGIALIGNFVLLILSPLMYNLFIAAFFNFFGQAAVTNTVQEAMGWSFNGAWVSFNYGIILMFIGALIMLIKNIKDEHPYQIFALVWSLIILIATIQHVRYEYYLAVNIVLLSAVTISYISERGIIDVKLLITKLSADEQVVTKPLKKSSKKKVQYKESHYEVSPNYLVVLIFFISIILCGLFIYTSESMNYANAAAGGIRMNPDWKESLEWMEKNTPDVGINYTQIQDIKTFKYPDAAYGVMSWWDYGHMITYIAKRIPNANPFQQGVVNEAGSATFFISTDEVTANKVLDTGKTRYIITDIEMATGKFYAMTTWYNPVLAVSPYQQYMFVQTGLNTYNPTLVNTKEYYFTMISRLHNFDGSYISPIDVYYIEYSDPELAQTSIPVITFAQIMKYQDAQLAITEFNKNAPFGRHAMLGTPVTMIPIVPVPALQHYRLVHESPTNIYGAGNSLNVDVKYVKIFEYVKGARIKGNGFIEVLIQTNTGRQFFYQQESVDGEFIVPYSTTGSPYDTKAVNKYHIIGTDLNQQYEVTEEDVMQGRFVG
jgi:dolichyl-phosphooligosaccharide-protein glycotransferase